MDNGKPTEQDKAELFQKAVYFFIGFSIFVFILCGIAYTVQNLMTVALDVLHPIMMVCPLLEG